MFRGSPLAALEEPSALDSDERIDADGTLDAELLGAILDVPLDPSIDLAAQTRVNPCRDELLLVERKTPERKTSLGVLETEEGFTHYRLDVRSRKLAIPTDAYAECCTRADCGAGIVSGLSFGDGRLAFGEGTRPGGRSDLALRLADGPLELEIDARDRIRGAVAFSLDASVAPAPPPSAVPWPSSLLERRMRIETENAGGSYRICNDRLGCMPENEFVRQYRDAGGAAELDEFERDWGADIRGAGGVLLALGLLTSGSGIGMTQTEPDPDPELRTEQDRATGVVLGMGLLTTAVGTALVAVPYDGMPEDHALSLEEAQRFVARYNRTLRGSEPPRITSSREDHRASGSSEMETVEASR